MLHQMWLTPDNVTLFGHSHPGGDINPSGLNVYTDGNIDLLFLL